MFQHITVLFSFVFVIPLTHMLFCVSKLILARDRVRFPGLHALWILNALMVLLSTGSPSGNSKQSSIGRLAKS